jgi:hypothetical protein
MFTFAQPAAINFLKVSFESPVPPWRNDWSGASGDDFFDPCKIDFWLGLIKAMRSTDRRRETVNSRCFDEFDAPLDRNQFP